MLEHTLVALTHWDKVKLEQVALEEKSYEKLLLPDLMTVLFLVLAREMID